MHQLINDGGRQGALNFGVALAPFKIEAQHPDEFIAHVLTLAPPIALTAIKEMRARLKNPPFTPEGFLDLLARQGLPQTVAILR